MNTNLVICPTISRPEQCTRMLNSFYRNSVESDIILLTAKRSITELINGVNYDAYKYVCVTNDDFIYHTHGWDRKLINVIERKGNGFAFGDDGSGNKHLPTTCIMPTTIPRALGWIQLPGLKHLCGDMVWQTLGKMINGLYYVPEVKIEHKHFLFNKANKEDYLISNSREMYESDNKTFQKWLLNECTKDVAKLAML